MNTIQERLQELEEKGLLPVSAAKLELEALCAIADALNRISANTRTQWPISTTCEVIPLNNDNEDNQ
mgnify:FL=1